jgi:thiol-disulfide isomerase/thioredoxin
LHDDWQIRSLEGKPVQLAAFKGKVIFLNFWATSCGPCVAEIPGIEGLYDSVKNENVAFLAVSQEKPERMHEFLEKNRLTVPIYLAEEKLPPDLPVLAIPVTYILDRNGKAVFRSVGAANWDDDSARSFIRALETQ